MQRAAAEFIIPVSSDRILHGAVSMIQSKSNHDSPGALLHCRLTEINSYHQRQYRHRMQLPAPRWQRNIVVIVLPGGFRRVDHYTGISNAGLMYFNTRE
uniref:Uncharacterized protein n=1 Tax=Anopheles funestus TaxID=62324 RepID=A0A182R5I0_ANOFN